MKKIIFRVSGFCLLLSISSAAFSQDASGPAPDKKIYRMNPFTGIGKNIGAGFTGNNLLLHSIGILSTFIIVQSDIDYKVHAFFNKHTEAGSLASPAARMGMIVPVVLGSGLYLTANLFNQGKEIAAGSAILQASLVSLTYSWALKAFTGRPGPHPDEYGDMRKASRIFRFGFLRGGIFWGWPSGHLMVNTAAMTSLAYFYRESTLLHVLCGMYVAYMFYGVNAHDGGTMHWFSDTVAGTLMGFAIGSTAGKNFRENWDKNEVRERAERLQITPVLSLQAQAVYISMQF
jgi:membrane-associated phospholipid phosphatase